MPAIAVILPVYNRAPVVRRAIDSVLAQEFGDFELVVVDDGSTDRTEEVVSRVADPRVRLIRLSSNRGSNSARNEGIRATTAPILCFLDSDDEYLPDKLGYVARRFAERPDLDVLVDSFIKLPPPSARRQIMERRNRPTESQEAFRIALFSRRLWKATPAISVRREIALEVGLFDESLKRLQDFDFLARVSSVGRCATTPQLLWIKHASSDAISASGDTLVRAYIELCRRHPQFVTNRTYRPGLAKAVGRQIRRHVAKGRMTAAAADLRRLARAFGWRRSAALVLAGSRPRVRLSARGA